MRSEENCYFFDLFRPIMEMFPHEYCNIRICRIPFLTGAKFYLRHLILKCLLRLHSVILFKVLSQSKLVYFEVMKKIIQRLIWTSVAYFGSWNFFNDYLHLECKALHTKPWRETLKKIYEILIPFKRSASHPSDFCSLLFSNLYGSRIQIPR